MSFLEKLSHPQMLAQNRIAEHATVVIHLFRCHQQLSGATKPEQRLGVIHGDQRITCTVDKKHRARDVHHPWKAGSKKCEKEWSARSYQKSVYSDHVPEVRALGDEIMNDITSNLLHWHFIAKVISLIPHTFTDILARPTFSPPVFLPTLPTGTSDGFGRRC